MKKLLFILALLIPFSLVSLGQVDYTDAQMFGSSREVPGSNSHDFGQITNEVVQHGFIIKNPYKVPITVSNVEISKGIGVLIVDEQIAAESIGKIIVLVYKNYMEPGDFEKNIIVNTEYEILGTKKTSKHTYIVKGSL